MGASLSTPRFFCKRNESKCLHSVQSHFLHKGESCPSVRAAGTPRGLHRLGAISIEGNEPSIRASAWRYLKVVVASERNQAKNK